VDEVARALDGSALVAHRRLVVMSRNVGFGRACNRGAEEFPTHDVLLLNPDAVVQPGAVTALRQVLATHSGHGAAGPRILRFDGAPEPGCRRSLPRPGVALGRLTRLDRLFPTRFGTYNLLAGNPAETCDIEAGSGCCVLLRREAWDGVRGFDPRFFMYGEDLDLFLRLGAAGWPTRYVPEALVLHRKGASTDRVRTRMLVEFHRAMWLYYRKHHMHGAGALLAPVVLAGLGARLAVLAATGAMRPRAGPRPAATAIG
jgi:GT2 family glycosyltransferase